MIKRFKEFLIEYLLLEDRISFLQKHFAGKLDSSHDMLSTHNSSDDIINHFATHADPTKNKSYTQWILTQYQQKNIRQEDHPRINETLKNFDRYKSKLPEKDINRYKTLGDIDAAVEPHINTPVTNREKSAEKIVQGRDLIHSSDNMKVYHLKTKEASKECYGGGSAIGNTDWCTAARSDKNMFDSYNSRGPLYTFHVKNDKGGTSLYQFSPVAQQFMDAKDKSVRMEDFSKQYPEIKNIPHLIGTHTSLVPDAPKNEQERMSLSNNLGKFIDSNNTISREYFKHAMNHNYLSNKVINKLIDSNNYSEYRFPLEYPHILKQDHVDKYVKKWKNNINGNGLFVGLYNHPLFNEHHINELLNHTANKDPGFLSPLMYSPNFTSNNMDTLVNNISKHSTSRENWDRINKWHIQDISEHPLFTPEHRKQLSANPNIKLYGKHI